MKEQDFRRWLEADGQAPDTLSSRISNARRIERWLGDLDELFETEGAEALLARFAYSAEDERDGRPNPTSIRIEGDLRENLASLRAALALYDRFRNGAPRAAGAPPTRQEVEAAMDAWDAWRATGAHAEAFEGFGEPSQFWVRSTRDRPDRIYPSKPVAGFARNLRRLNGGWTQKTDAAALLNNAGFIIVDRDGAPLAPPEGSAHLIGQADRIRLCALNYRIEPAREAGAGEVSIPVRDLARDMGLINAFPAICDALGKRKFQRLARVSAPTATEPNPSGTTVFTFQLAATEGPQTMTDTPPAGPSAATPPATTNLILYGPPGTGKTYATAWEAVRLCLGDDAAEALREDRPALMAEYRRLTSARRIAFVTFHQSFAYEEFVEGLKPPTSGDDGGAGFRLEVVPGILRTMARLAASSHGPVERMSLEGRPVFKMSMGNTGLAEDADLFDEAVEGGYATIGFEAIDWSDDRYADRAEIARVMREQGRFNVDAHENSGSVQMTDAFRNQLAIGDVLVVSKGNKLIRAIGQVTGGYEFQPRPDGKHSHRRAVRWLWVDREGIPASDIFNRQLGRRTIYRLAPSELNPQALARYAGAPTAGGAPEPFVLIIDEINRANISKVFGELITLLEPDKRIGAENEIRVTLPYSGEAFGLPSNLHIIGAMNTADRSIALLDTALRRRFAFRELMPDVGALARAMKARGLDAGDLDGIDLGRLLTTINERIEYLFDREHQIGHAYFTACRNRADVEAVMRDKVIPLLAEYFYEDWSKVAAVLGDGAGDGSGDGSGVGAGRFLESRRLTPPRGLADDEGGGEKRRWSVRATFDFAEFEA